MTYQWYRCRLVYFFFTFFLCISILLYISALFKIRTKKSNEILGQGCKLLSYRPFFETTHLNVRNETLPDCNSGRPLLLKSNYTSLSVNRSAFNTYKVTDPALLYCCYWNFWTVPPNQYESHSRLRFSHSCIRFKENVVVTEEFVKVYCYYNGSMILKDYFAFVPPKELKKPPKAALSVLVLGIDLISGQNAMPQTLKYLIELNSVQMYGHNVVPDGTYLNTIPLLTGNKTCLPKKRNRLDDCPFVWKDFKKKGFATAFAENFLDRRKWEFEDIPTDYYWNPYHQEVEDKSTNKSNGCFGIRMHHQSLLDYADKFTEAMRIKSQPYFGFFWERFLGHNTFDGSKRTDADYADFLLKLKQTGRLRNTILVFTSGLSLSNIGKNKETVEEPMPILHLVLPEKFRLENTQLLGSLLKNRHRLTTHYDLHLTLKDLVDLRKLTSKHLLKRKNRSFVGGYSLFDEIPEKRSCEEAHIDPRRCLCPNSFKLNPTDEVIVEGANYVLGLINHKLKDKEECAVLEMKRITSAYEIWHSDDVMNKDYTIIFETSPGEAVFEATVRWKKENATVSYQVLRTNRINEYNKQSRCVSDVQLKWYCFCKTHVEWPLDLD